MSRVCYLCNFLRSFACAFDRINAPAGRIHMKFLRFFGPFFTQIGPKVDFTPGAIRILFCCYQTWKFNEDLKKLF